MTETVAPAPATTTSAASATSTNSNVTAANTATGSGPIISAIPSQGVDPSKGEQSGAGGAAPAVKTGDWRSSMPEKFQVDPVFKNFQTQEDLLNSYAHAQRMIGRDPSQVAKKPGHDATPEEKRAYYEFNGTPKDAAQFKAPDFSKDEALKGVSISEDGLKAFQKEAWEKGFTQDQFETSIKTLVTFEARKQAAELMEHNNLVKQTNEALKNDWGLAYDSKVDAIKRAFNVLGTPELKAALDNAGMGANKEFLGLMAKVGESITEDASMSAGAGPTGGTILTPNEAMLKINEQMQNPVFMSKLMAGDKDAIAERTRLFDSAYPQPRA